MIVGDDDFGEFGGKVGGLGDDPDAGFGPGDPVTTPPISYAPTEILASEVCCASPSLMGNANIAAGRIATMPRCKVHFPAMLASHVPRAAILIRNAA